MAVLAMPAIHIEDVELFFEVYDAAGGRPTAGQIQRHYLDAGSAGLHRFAEARNTTAARIADAIAEQPEIYANARRCLSVLPRVKDRVADALQRLG